MERALFDRTERSPKLAPLPRILLADDNPEILDTVSEVLRRDCLIL